MAGKQTTRKTRAPRLKTARAAFDKARSELARARKKGDAKAIAGAAGALESATRQLGQANLDRFEQLVGMRTATACNALEEIIKLANQRRYVIDAHHAGVILDAISENMVSLQTALNAAVSRGQQPVARRAIVFAPAPADDPHPPLTPLERAIAEKESVAA